MVARKKQPSKNSSRPRWQRWSPVSIVCLVAAMWWFSRSTPEKNPPPSATNTPPTPTQVSSVKWEPIAPDTETFALYAGSASCTECHGAKHDSWLQSHHAMAERLPSAKLDQTAFDPPRKIQHGDVTTSVRADGDTFVVNTLGLGNKMEDHEVIRVIGHDPLRQFLVNAGDGRLQALEMAFDPHKNEWFDVFGEEHRRPGEWGHWTGRGMNWNSMCASCHNTRLRKNYDATTDSYHTTMAEMTVGCEACHGPMKQHVLAYKAGTKPPPAAKPTREQIMNTCGTCHSRRAELTGDFQPGDDYFDHYHLTVPDLSDLYYADGQVRGEDYVFGSFLGSRMHAAGVTCLDCHDPHTTKTILPGNALCLRCHNGSYPRSPKINPAEHTFHKNDSAGNLCVNCHMPITIYMQRHPRRDHGFTIPDPLLTKQYGIPNACNRCHTDKDTDWALAAVTKNYGDKMNRHTRSRAQAIARARAGDLSVKPEILQLLTGDETPYWKAVAANVIDPWLADADVQQALMASLESTNALVRSQVAFALAPAAQANSSPVRTALREHLNDPIRSVRVNAAWGLRNEVPLDATATRELQRFLQFNADQPTGLLQLGSWELARNNPNAALTNFEKAVSWDPNSAPLRHELAVLYGMMNRPADALKELQAAVRIAPNDAEFQYKLGLAWNEMGDLTKATQALEKAVELNPRHARAWYNLGLARQQVGLSQQAIDALYRAESIDPRDPGIPYARATIHAQLGQANEARAAAERALSIDPSFAAARQLIDSLR
ncbi:tetratricopeptide repeat protein [bacterium]|nr:tetratricopeptide repeat protein [bacterium]